ncbi:fructosamine kinase family protein [Halobaculum limi]|uniref:fructosamine kinase family protein n=1 Tax=Halobaculum limi TaxID=3031916 RepID=UPI0024067865|nr:fructosamine kinase family protein [Halobaculum sp. YSMS11]
MDDIDDETRTRIVAWADCDIASVALLDGGEVGTVHRVDLVDGRRVVAKTGPTDPGTEARMLRHLTENGGLRVPDVYHAGDDLLVMEFVDGDGPLTASVERDLADRLAALHATDADAFGFPFDTLTGPYDQPNPWTDSWPEFFGEQRLRHAATQAHDESVLPATDLQRVETLVSDLPAILDHDPTPSLIHGDVWRENVRTDGTQVTALLDPACYYADREVELAYVEWTETGGEAFVERYREVAGVDDGYREREPVYRLYPLLTHLRYFGEEYLETVRGTLSTLGY